MSKRNQVEFDAAVKIEVLRARAALERLTLTEHVEELSEQANPLNMILGLVEGPRRNWLSKGVDFLGKYPMILAAIATVLTGSSSGWARAGGIAISSVQSVLEKQGAKSTKSS